MATTKLAFLAVAVLLLQASCRCAVAQQGGNAVAGRMALTSFQSGGAACDGKKYSDDGLFAAPSTQWYASGNRCHKKIRITSSDNANTVVAEVVDECDSHNGCQNDIIATSKAVWAALKLNTNDGVVPIAWADVQ